MSENLTLTVARYAATTSCADIPAPVRERAKQVILDEIACAYFGRRSLAGDLSARYAAQSGGPAEARIYATGQRVSAPYAALANGAAGHGEEVDGAHIVGGHPGATIVHAAVAMAERQRVTGAELLNAVVLGYDVGIRIVEACGKLFSVKNRFGLNSDFLYALGAAAAASRLLGLDPVRHCHAMALTTFQSNALCALYAEKRHVSKSFCNGQFAFAGVSSALMSVAGLEGHEDILGASYGVLHAWGEDGQRDAVVRGLGEHYAIMDANFKLLNAGYPIHSPVEAALTLVAKHGIAVDAIESVYVGMPTQTMKVVDGRDMHNICLQDMLSAALVQGGLKLRESPFPEVLADPAFSRLRPRVTLCGDPELDRDQPDGRGAIVAITTMDGSTVSMRVDHPRGHSKRGGLTWAELSGKWHEGLPECDVDRMLAIAQRLEDIEDVTELLDVFRAKG
ncbi:MmgE/PrpD family protein [Paraburkholderia domus]|uniref:2-methylcitrate dehydratase n=1 Tax=Paraburkholderia domus TaxID=2793075 RepID=A0A9N8NEQ0_9BURK|nr:MmgE/PrpD family protein [Paraburkholderia domus]MBK5053722.1 MmgE/PrpD family protein [Burkholderia sp. R-70006]MBK5065626.1 MmgE/PrpD family protein [Burkholderia sp. R-70199]MBK5169755.1 MmgE/PrpD family protein [Burkholderia sp. R-70211]MBK5186370.1 MmgE/PrpD family protein [Burkholderia sp. R-69749]CAE6843206.1 2-methylcitrate dehydratase [Paraburkholderia domus]